MKKGAKVIIYKGILTIWLLERNRSEILTTLASESLRTDKSAPNYGIFGLPDVICFNRFIFLWNCIILFMVFFGIITLGFYNVICLNRFILRWHMFFWNYICLTSGKERERNSDHSGFGIIENGQCGFELWHFLALWCDNYVLYILYLVYYI